MIFIRHIQRSVHALRIAPEVSYASIIVSRLTGMAGRNEPHHQHLSATSNFPKHELYGLSQQIRRAAVSVPSNIAEGKGRYSDRDFVRFLLAARGSLLELETQLLIAQELGYATKTDTDCLLGMAESVGRALSGLINSLSQQAA